MKIKTAVATEKFLSGYNCTQSVLFAYAPEVGLDTETALKIACGFGGGVSHRGEICGAISGGVQVIGLKYGRGSADDRSATDKTYQKADELISRFERQHGSSNCRVLLEGCDFRTPEGRRRFVEQGLRQKTCVKCVQTVSDLLAEIVD